MRAKKKQKPAILLTQILTFWLVFFYFLTSLSLPALGWTFNPNNILTDAELRDKNSLSRAAIQAFFERENSVLKNFSDTVDGQIKSASQIVWEVAQKQNISPKFLLATLEKEKGLIQKSTASQKDLDWATGYSCFNNQCNEKYKGFFHQVESTAITQNIYNEKAAQFEFKVGQAVQTHDKYTILPENQATANLYIYTPFVGYAPDFGYTNIQNVAGKFGANFLFWQIWNRYFTDRKVPNGFTVKNNGTYWLIEKGQKRRFASNDIFLQDYSDATAITLDDETLRSFPEGPALYFADNTLVRADATNEVFLITQNTKRQIMDAGALALLPNVRFALSSLEEVPVVSTSMLAVYPSGTPISTASVYPQGKIVQDETGEIFLLQDNLKYPVTQDVWKIAFNSVPPASVTLDSISPNPVGSPILLPDGTVIRNSQGSYYLISDKEKIKISDPAVFTRLFGSGLLDSAITVSDETMALHKDGLNIDYIDDTITDPVVTTPPPTQALSAQLIEVVPDGMVAFVGTKVNVVVKIKNTGSSTWQKSDVWLTLNSSSNIFFNESSIAPNDIATFTTEIVAPATPGLKPISFSVAYSGGSLASFGKFMLVKSGETAEIVSHTIPVAVKAGWKSVPITMKIKNTSESTVWLSRKTALEIYAVDGSTSPFYDKSDWVRKEVASVPTNKSQIKSGETGTFSFTLNLRGVKPGTYAIKFKLNLLDKGKMGVLNGGEEWIRYIRVDK